MRRHLRGRTSVAIHFPDWCCSLLTEPYQYCGDRCRCTSAQSPVRRRRIGLTDFSRNNAHIRVFRVLLNLSTMLAFVYSLCVAKWRTPYSFSNFCNDRFKNAVPLSDGTLRRHNIWLDGRHCWTVCHTRLCYQEKTLTILVSNSYMYFACQFLLYHLTHRV